MVVFCSDGPIADRLREEALLERFARVDVDRPRVVAVHPRENENAWLLGYDAVRKGVGVVGARGFEPPGPTPRIMLPEVVARALRAAG